MAQDFDVTSEAGLQESRGILKGMRQENPGASGPKCEKSMEEEAVPPKRLQTWQNSLLRALIKLPGHCDGT